MAIFAKTRVRMPVANPPPNTIEVVKTEEKGSDVNLSVHMTRDAYLQKCEKQVVITNDSDLAEPIRLVRQDTRIPVGIVNPHAGSRRTTRLTGDFYRYIRPGNLAAYQLPTFLKDAAGPISKPSGW